MLKKLLFTATLIALIVSPTDLLARRGFGAGFGFGLLGGALLTSAAYNSYPGYEYGYYAPYPYPYAYGPYGGFYGPGCNQCCW